MLARTDISQWGRLWSDLEARGDPSTWHQRLTTAYREGARHYHNLQHLEECLTEFARVRSTINAPAAVEVRWTPRVRQPGRES